MTITPGEEMKIDYYLVPARALLVTTQSTRSVSGQERGRNENTRMKMCHTNELM